MLWSLESLDPRQVSNLDNAIANAREYASEVVAVLKSAAGVPEKAVVNG